VFDLVELAALHFTPKFDNISQLDYLFGISNEKSFCDEARALFVQLRLHQLVEMCPVGLLAHLVALMLVGCSEVNVLLVFVIHLKLKEIYTLLV